LMKLEKSSKRGDKISKRRGPHASLENQTPQELVQGLINQQLPPLSAA
jgi:hypothetical protein